MEKQITQKPAQNLLSRVFLLAIGGLIGWFLGQSSVQGNYQVPFLGFLGLFVLAIVVHELGHSVGAVIVNFRICSFTVGPITILRSTGRTTIRWGTLRIGGMVSAAPNGTHDLRRRMLVLVAAGPAASLLGGVPAALIGWILPASPITAAIRLGGLISCGLGLLSLIPSRRYYTSDGAKIWDLIRSKERGERQCTLLALLGALNAGVRPREWDAELVGRLLVFKDGSGQDVMCEMYAFWWAKDRRDFDVAQRHLEAAAERQRICPPAVKSSIALDAAFFYSFIRGDSTAGRKWLDQCKRRLISDRYFLLTAEAAVLLSEGKTSEAQDAACQAIKALPKAQFVGFAVAAKDWLEMIIDAAEHGRYHIESSALSAAVS